MILVRYYVKDDPKFQVPREFDADLFWRMSQHPQGEFYLSNDKEKIIYDRNKGQAELVFLDSNPNLNISYAPDITNQILTPVKNAMAGLAKLELLRELAKLDDPEINKIVSRTDDKLGTMRDPREMENLIKKSLKEIFDYISPHPSRGLQLFSREKYIKPQERTKTQDAIYDALLTLKKQSRDVTSTADVQQILQQIKQPEMIAVAAHKA